MTDQELDSLLSYALEPFVKETYVGVSIRRMVDEIRNLRAQVAAQAAAQSSAIQAAADAATPTATTEEQAPAVTDVPVGDGVTQ
jgi:hypothetical protein